MTPSEKFFVECIKTAINNGKIDKIEPDVDYKKLFYMIKVNAVSVMVYRVLKDLRNLLPEGFFNALETDYQNKIAKYFRNSFEEEKLLLDFEKNGFDFMPLKGYVIRNLYPAPEMRFSSDSDILVKEKDLSNIKDYMLGSGFKLEKEDSHHDGYYNPSTMSIYELHKKMFVGSLENHFGTWHKFATLKEGYKHFYELSATQFYVSILAHLAYHFAEGAGVGIRNIADIYLLKNKTDINREELEKELVKLDLLTFTKRIEELAEYLFGNFDGSDYIKDLANHVINSELLEKAEDRDAKEIYASDDEKKGKKRARFRKIFPARKKMIYLYPWAKCFILLPFSYVARWFRVIFTDPKAIKKVNAYSNVDQEKIKTVKNILDGLEIKNLITWEE